MNQIQNNSIVLDPDSEWESFTSNGDFFFRLKEEFKELDYCLHDWKAYMGFTEKYDYCAKCDKKR